MAQATQQFTPSQILEAGRRAEIEGRVEYAIQFYRHLTDHMPRTQEALVAEQALLRLGAVPAPGTSAGTSTSNGHYQVAASSANGAGSGMAAAYTVPPNTRALVPARNPGTAPPESEDATRRRFVMPRLRRRYRTGRFIARVFTFLGFFEISIGTLMLCVAGVMQAGLSLPGLPPLIAGQSPLIAVSLGAALIVVGGVLVLGGQLARALFDQASATRDLAALSRARAAFNTVAQNATTPHV
jgi:hypothetical protein